MLPALTVLILSELATAVIKLAFPHFNDFHYNLTIKPQQERGEKFIAEK